MTHTPHIAVIGCGHWGKNLVRNFSELGALYSVCDHDPDIAAKFAHQYAVKAQDWDSVLADDQVKGIVIASPAPFHFDMAQAALKAGKDVYVEKPITLKDEHAQTLCDLAKEHNAILMVGHLLQYHPAFLALKDMVMAGDFGELHYIYSNRLSFGKVRREENVLWSFAPHDVSMVLALAGGQKPSFVDATGACQTHDKIADFVNVQMRFPSGLAAHITVSWINPFKEQKLVVIGDKGMAVFDDRLDWSEKLTLYPHVIDSRTDVPTLNPAEASPHPLPEGEPLKAECEHFLESIKTRTTPRTDGEEGLRVLNVLNMADKAMMNKI